MKLMDNRNDLQCPDFAARGVHSSQPPQQPLSVWSQRRRILWRTHREGEFVTAEQLSLHGGGGVSKSRFVLHHKNVKFVCSSN